MVSALGPRGGGVQKSFALPGSLRSSPQLPSKDLLKSFRSRLCGAECAHSRSILPEGTRDEALNFLG